jgi:dual specificity phosphatase 3
MANLNFITPRLATGGDLPEASDDADRDLEEWRRLGITHVVDNRIEWDDAEFVHDRAPEILYLHNGVDDAGDRQPDEWFDRGVAWIRQATQDPDATVFVHCHMGINRGPSLAYAALLDQGWDPVEAIDAIRTARPIAGVGYAEDALDWHHRRQGVDEWTRAEDRRRLAAWREANYLDVVRIIRRIRADEQAARTA